ncbi:hypothetical protein F4801DRAFT_42971 [Xylaria longipes]|nr:hypothetical protein F4801DRAFT_42971 [Xylaria longipes]
MYMRILANWQSPSYDDNDGLAPTATAPASAPAPVPAPAPVAASITPPVAQKAPEPQPEHAFDEMTHGAAENGYGDDYHEDAYDDDDDVDFDLGNGPTNSTMAAPMKHEESPGPSFHTTRGPSAKEDGELYSLPRKGWFGSLDHARGGIGHRGRTAHYPASTTKRVSRY